MRAESSSSESEIEMDIRDESKDDSEYEQYYKDLFKQDDDEEGEEEEIDEINRQTDEKKTNKKTRMRAMEMEDESREDKENTQKAEDSISNIRNDWLLVKFCSKRSVKHYVGVVLRITDDGVPVVQYLRKTLTKVEDQTMFTYPALEDISEVKHQEDIVTKLPKPVIGRRGQIIFKMSFKTFNVE